MPDEIPDRHKLSLEDAERVASPAGDAAPAVTGNSSIRGFMARHPAVLQELLSRVSSYNWLCTVALSPVGYALAGPASAQFGARAALLFGAIWAVFSGLAVPCMRNVNRLRWVGA